MSTGPHLPPSSSAAVVAAVRPSRHAVLDLDTATLDDLRLIDRRWNALRMTAFATTPAWLQLMNALDPGLALHLPLMVAGLTLMTVAAVKPSVLMRVVARAHGCSPALTTKLMQACDSELAFYPSSRDGGTHLERRLAHKDVQFHWILSHRE